LIAEFTEKIQSAFPDLVITSLRKVEEGLVNDVIIVNESRVFRFPKTDWAREDLAQEVKLLQLIHQHVAIRLPEFDRIADGMVSYEMIPGRALLQLDIQEMNPDHQNNLARDLGIFLTQLHNIPLPAGQRPSVAQKDRAYWLKLYEDCKALAYPFMWSDNRDWVERHFAPVVEGYLEVEAYTPVLINGDISPNHVLFDRTQGTISGIIDFGTAGAGDPATDIGLLLLNYGEEFIRKLEPYYTRLPDVIEHARFIAGAVEVGWVVDGLKTDDKGLFVAHIGRSRDRRPIGSGWS